MAENPLEKRSRKECPFKYVKEVPYSNKDGCWKKDVEFCGLCPRSNDVPRIKCNGENNCPIFKGGNTH